MKKILKFTDDEIIEMAKQIENEGGNEEEGDDF